MKKAEFLEIVFRCHYAGELMTNARGKSNLQKFNEATEKLAKYSTAYEAIGNKETKTAINKLAQIEKLESEIVELSKVKDLVELSGTAKKRLRTIMIEYKYGRKKRLENKYVKKGKECEEEAITIYSKYKHKNYKNNKGRIVNDYLSGEVDLKDEKAGETVKVIDIKNRYDIDTFFDKEDNENSKADYWQLVAYTALIPTVKTASIANCLVNNTLDAIQLELKREEWLWNEGIVPQKRQVEIITDNIYDKETFLKYVSLLVGVIDKEGQEAVDKFVEVSEKDRVLEVEQDRDDEAINKLYKRLEECRVYMANKWGE